ncbi:hypothetical protein GQ600_16880 [Phytophthora cactorum]|nr:hypothetical protein GQ600_23981 [Phytophthora cactorum]KAF1784295.1 hypothetical protein GQ600_16880 [Phytophthora cactorum]
MLNPEFLNNDVDHSFLETPRYRAARAALLKNEQRRQGRLLWRPQTDDDVATKFLKTVEIGTRSVWGSSGERSQCRHKAFAYQTRFGQPALFVTLNPQYR